MVFSISSGRRAGTGSGVTPSRWGRMPSRTRLRYRRQISGLTSLASFGRLGEHEDDERYVGLLQVVPELSGRLGSFDQRPTTGAFCDRA